MESALERVQRELPRLDLLIHREVMRLRARYQLSLDEFRGLYISNEHVDQLLRNSEIHRLKPTRSRPKPRIFAAVTSRIGIRFLNGSG